MIGGQEQADYMRLLDPQALAKIHRLELIARGVVEGFVAGRHRSPYKGFSVEFAEHRQYAPGDDIRMLDWRVLGRSDRYYVKQFIEETNLRATVLVDASASMRYTGQRAATREGKRLSKFEYAQLVAASLSHLMIHQQDAVGLVTFDTEVRRYIPPRSRVSHLRAILAELHETKPGGETALAPVLHDIAERIRRRGLVVIVSDALDDVEEILNALHHFRYRKHEVILLHVLADEEVTFPFDRFGRFRDLEGPSTQVQLDPRAIRAQYLREVGKFLHRLETGCGSMSVDYVPLSTRRDFDVALSHYLAHRRSHTK
jgi:uncharacterized protein (DUF58 family)